MSEQPRDHATSSLILHEPGELVIRNINWAGMFALYMKLQTVWAPALTTLLYLVIFTLALGRGGVTIMGASFADFIAPGLIIMGMIQNAYQNASFSLLVGKMQGTIVDFLMPPVSAAELLFALVASSITRAVMVGFAIWFVMLFWPGVHVMPTHPWAVIWFGLMGTAMLSFIGVLTSIWAEKFDHAAAIANFVVAPLSLLSGTF
jgi:ABC-2 type transport system permease protein